MTSSALHVQLAYFIPRAYFCPVDKGFQISQFRCTNLTEIFQLKTLSHANNSYLSGLDKLNNYDKELAAARKRYYDSIYR